MNDSIHDLEFTVTLCLGGGDGGDVCVHVDVTDEEYEEMIRGYREDGELWISDELCKRIEEAAQDENECLMAGMDTDEEMDADEEIDYDSVSYIIMVPDEIVDAADEAE